MAAVGLSGRRRARFRGSPDTANGSGHPGSERPRDIRGMEPLAGIAFRAAHRRVRSPPIPRERASANIDECNSRLTGIGSPTLEHRLTSHAGSEGVSKVVNLSGQSCSRQRRRGICAITANPCMTGIIML